jgi:hypothetical protein
VAHTLRQAEEQSRRTLANLRAEILQLLLEYDTDSIKRQLLREYHPTPAKPLPSSAEEYRP